MKIEKNYAQKNYAQKPYKDFTKEDKTETGAVAAIDGEIISFEMNELKSCRVVMDENDHIHATTTEGEEMDALCRAVHGGLDLHDDACAGSSTS
eukprot:16067073-Heterocapsa_arctica.AAC.1